MTKSINYGDIIMVDLNPVKGEEISKIRPCVVISNRILNQKSPFLIIVPLTGSVDRLLSWHVLVKSSPKNGLSQDSKALPEQIKSISKFRVEKILGNLEKKYLRELEKKIAFMINQRKDF